MLEWKFHDGCIVCEAEPNYYYEIEVDYDIDECTTYNLTFYNALANSYKSLLTTTSLINAIKKANSHYLFY